MIQRGIWLTAFVVVSLSAGCAFSSFQSAKMLPQGGTRLGVGIVNYRLEGTDPSGDTSAIEATGSHGLMPNFELGGKLAYFSQGGVNFYNLLLSPKISIIPDVLAVTAQSGLMISDEDDVETAWLTMPGIVYTYPLHPQVDLHSAVKLVAAFADDFDDSNFAGAANVGIQWTPAGQRFSVFPEIGFAYDDDAFDGDDNGVFVQIGFAIQIDFGPRAEPPIQQQPQSQGMDPAALMMLMRMLQQGRGQQAQPVGVMNQWAPVQAPLGGAAAGLGGGAGGSAFPAGMLSSFGRQVPSALSGLDFAGMGGAPAPEDRDPDLTEAGKGYTTMVPGAAIFDSAVSFALIRGGRLSATILGALQVSATGDLANWHVPGGRPGVGGAMDLVQGARRVWIAMEHVDRRSGSPKIVEKCEYPLTGRGVVDRVYTDLAVFDVTGDGLVLTELAPGVDVAYVRERTGAPFRLADGLGAGE